MRDLNDTVTIVDRLARDVVAKHAVEVDRTAQFPQAAMDALRQAGLLGLISDKSVGGRGEGLRSAALVVERLAKECASTAMVFCMHIAATAVIEKLGPKAVREEIARGEHLATLAFSENGSRSQFWAPVGAATVKGTKVTLNAQKSFVTAAQHAKSYVWSSRPLEGKEASTLWLVSRETPGIRPGGAFDGLGLRGNDSRPVVAEAAEIDASSVLGKDGEGFKWMMEVVLPFFNVMSAASSIGIMDAATTRSAAHVAGSKFTHSDTSIAELPTVRAFLARMRIQTDLARALLLDTLEAVEAARPDTMLRVLEVKAAAGEAATSVVDLAMRVTGGAAFRKDVGIERLFRDARAGLVMSPTTDQLYDFIGKAVCDMPLF